MHRRRPPGHGAYSVRPGRAEAATTRKRREVRRRVPPEHFAAARYSPAPVSLSGEKQSVEPLSISSLLGLDVDQAGAGHPIVHTLPFPLHFHSMLGSGMSEAGIGSGQRILSFFSQHVQFY